MELSSRIASKSTVVSWQLCSFSNLEIQEFSIIYLPTNGFECRNAQFFSLMFQQRVEEELLRRVFVDSE